MKLGNCFKRAGELMITICQQDLEARKHLRLVHGRATRCIPPHIKYGHAWVEIDGEDVIDPDQYITCTRDEYYQLGGIDSDSCIQYSYKEMVTLMDECGHWGPWDLKELPEEVEFRKQCSNH